MADALLTSPMGQNHQEPLSQLVPVHAGLARTAAIEALVHANRAAVYAYIVRYWMEHGLPPTIRQIGDALGIRSTNTVAYHLDQLIQRGLLSQRRRKRCHGLTLAQWCAGYPVIGVVTHGQPQSHLGILEAGLIEPSASYVLLVEDLALEETHLCAGDGLIVEPAERTRRSGQLVVARQTEPDEIAALSLAKVSEGGQLVGMAKQASVMPCELSHAQVQGVVSSMVRLYR